MINLKELTLRRGVKVVLERTNLTIHPGEKVALVGRNGAGKSSLFMLLTHRLSPDAGDVEIPPRWVVGEVAQHMPETTNSATDFVLEGDHPLAAAKAALALAEEQDDGHAMAEAHGLLAEAGAFDANARAQALLMGLGFKVDQLDAPVNSFSGGWRMRLQLARALMNPSDLLLLDEPTNHLDLDALVWLEGWLLRYTGTMVVISHDREFLDAITRVTVHLDHAQLTRYTGNYSAFEEMRAERMGQLKVAHERQQQKAAHLQKFIDRFKAKASKAKQAQSRVKALARMERLGPLLVDAEFDFEFKEPKTLPDPMVTLDALDCGYAAGHPIVNRATASVRPGERIGILGANGQGKSTLVKTIAGMHKPLAGEMTQGKGLSIGYFAQQEMDLLSAEDTALQRMVRMAKDIGPPAREQELRDFLGSFNFVGAMVNQPVSQLSGGERARLVLAGIVWQRPNLLLLDEPTNHLDLTTREALSVALNEFEGTVMLVSHDRALLREVCDEFWLVAKGALGPFDGDLDDYQRWLNENSREAARALASEGSSSSGNGGVSKREDRKAAAQARAKLAEQQKPMRKRVAELEALMAKGERNKGLLEAELAAGAASGERIVEIGKLLKRAQDAIDTAETEWLSLQEVLESKAIN